MKIWKPINYNGSIYYDPRQELAARMATALENHDEYAAIPCTLIQAVVYLVECSATTILTGDEDGPLDPSVQVKCRKPANHSHDHDNGYISWRK